MPILHLHLLEGRSVEQKRELAQKLTDVICTTLDKDPSAVRIIFDDMKHTDYSIAGVLVADR